MIITLGILDMHQLAYLIMMVVDTPDIKRRNVICNHYSESAMTRMIQDNTRTVLQAINRTGEIERSTTRCFLSYYRVRFLMAITLICKAQVPSSHPCEVPEVFTLSCSPAITFRVGLVFGQELLSTSTENDLKYQAKYFTLMSFQSRAIVIWPYTIPVF